MSTSATKRKADELEEPSTTKKQKVEEERESDSEEDEGSEEEVSEDDIDEDELEDLHQDQEDAGDGYTGGRRTRGVKIDFSGKDNRANDDDEDDEDDEPVAQKEEEVVEGKGKGKAKPVSERSSGKPTSQAGGSSAA
ncbi:hypothetical protein FRB91_010155 [Serendipita sp. 411]|nr:hypothetical protein FRC16_008449 [Serendipita sp. 398]KAG8848735.1 hypothetical protein FRC20_002484 [Serendipita sp. 405]KAG8849216.1 hypothetical protein FRB91_010155 [Serendipita sp. 411]